MFSPLFFVIQGGRFQNHRHSIGAPFGPGAWMMGDASADDNTAIVMGATDPRSRLASVMSLPDVNANSYPESDLDRHVSALASPRTYDEFADMNIHPPSHKKV